MKDKLGFSYSPKLFSGVRSKIGVERACARFALRFPQYIWNDSVVAGKAYTYPQVKTLLDGVTTGGNRLGEQQDVSNQRQSLERLINMVRTGQFDISKQSFCSLHEIAAKQERSHGVCFELGGVGIAGTSRQPLAPEKLGPVFSAGATHVQGLQSVPEKALTFFLFGAFHQFFFDGNKRTSRAVMNFVLLEAGYFYLSVPGQRKDEFNSMMVEFYDTKDATAGMRFMLDCYREWN